MRTLIWPRCCVQLSRGPLFPKALPWGPPPGPPAPPWLLFFHPPPPRRCSLRALTHCALIHTLKSSKPLPPAPEPWVPFTGISLPGAQGGTSKYTRPNQSQHHLSPSPWFLSPSSQFCSFLLGAQMPKQKTPFYFSFPSLPYFICPLGGWFWA